MKNAKYLNVFSNEFLCGDIAVANGLIAGVGKYDGKTEIDVSGKLVLPGFIDAHIHLESSMVTPAEFAKAVVAHGTTTVITDPHEIANVMGIDGVEYMIQASQNLPIDVHFMMPSCVPATEIDVPQKLTRAVQSLVTRILTRTLSIKRCSDLPR